MTLHLNGQLPGEVAAHKVGQVPGEDEEEEAKGHGFLHSSVPVGLQHLPARKGREMTHTVRQTTPDTWQPSSASSSREGGEQEAAHGDQTQDHAAVLPGVVDTLLQQVEDPRRPVHTQRPAERRGAPVGPGQTDHHLAGQPRGDHDGRLAPSAGYRVSPATAAADAVSGLFGFKI